MTTGLVELTARLRQAGLPLGSTAAADFVEAIEAVGLESRTDTYYALRSLAITSPDQIPIFDSVFDDFFRRLPSYPLMQVIREMTRSWVVSLPKEAGEGAAESPDESTSTGASTVERLAHRDFSELSKEELEQLRRLMATLAWRPADVLSRRRRPDRHRGRPDLRRTLRNASGPTGDLMLLSYSKRRPRRRPLIFIADVSGSMERYTEMLLYFAHAARHRLGKMETFVFSTRLTRITRQLSRRSAGEALVQVTAAVDDWSGGTRIGDAIASFNRDWSRRLCRGGPVALIVSDGWDRGEPGLLAAEMARLHRTVNRVIWLNPLAGRTGYRPETQGIKAAMPYIDDLLAAGNLSDLATVVRLLESLPPRRTR